MSFDNKLPFTINSLLCNNNKLNDQICSTINIKKKIENLSISRNEINLNENNNKPQVSFEPNPKFEKNNFVLNNNVLKLNLIESLKQKNNLINSDNKLINYLNLIFNDYTKIKINKEEFNSILKSEKNCNFLQNKIKIKNLNSFLLNDSINMNIICEMGKTKNLILNESKKSCELNTLLNFFNNSIPFEINNQTINSISASIGGTEKRIGHSYQSRQIARHKKPRTSFSKFQVAFLENNFIGQKYLASTERAKIASQLNMSDAQVKTWYYLFFKLLIKLYKKIIGFKIGAQNGGLLFFFLNFYC